MRLWHRVELLGDDLESGERSLAQPTADLRALMMGKVRCANREPEYSFVLTSPAHSLRELAKGAVLRPAGQTERAVRQPDRTVGGDKIRALTAL